MGNASYTDYNPSVITDNSSRSQNLSFLRTNVERIGSISAKKIWIEYNLKAKNMIMIFFENDHFVFIFAKLFISIKW